MSCKYEIPWYGMCKEETKGDNIYCEKHLKHTCVICGDQAVTQCGFASSLTCGAPLCNNKECHEKHIANHNVRMPKKHQNLINTYQDNPVKFTEDILNLQLDPWQVDVIMGMVGKENLRELTKEILKPENKQKIISKYNKKYKRKE